MRTELGGAEAPLAIGESIPSLVDVPMAKQGKPGLELLDHRGRPVAW